MQRSVVVAVAVLVLTGCLFSNSYADVPLMLTHQGQLTDGSDAPLSGFFDITYRIFDVPAGGTELWSEVHPSVSVSDGLFSTTLGAITPLTLDILAGSGGGGGGGSLSIERYLEVQVGGDAPLTPRTRLLSSPYAAATGRVSGDLQTAPGALSISNAPGTRGLALMADDDSVTFSVSEGGVQRYVLSSGVPLSGSSFVRVAIGDLDGDGLPDLAMTSDPDSTSIAIGEEGVQRFAVHSHGTGGNFHVSSNGSSFKGIVTGVAVGITPISALYLDADDDNDGVAENSIEQTARTEGALLAIKTKGTGAQRTDVSLGTGPDSASIHCDLDSDGDGVPENSLTQVARTEGVALAIKTKGTGAQRLAVGLETYLDSARISCDNDSDDDGDPNQSIDMIVTPTTSGVAINTKGTGADKNRTASINTNDSLSQGTFDSDEDGDGISEAKITIQVRDQLGNPTSSLYLDRDSDDDGVSESSLRWNVDAQGPIIEFTESSVQRCLISPDSGMQMYDALGAKTCDLDSDGDGYLAGSLKIGTTSGTNLIEVNGGAYCNGTDWVNASDADFKENFEPVNGEEVLESLEQLEITRWNYKGQENAEHIGPTAQDFHAAFGVGGNDKTISTVDPSGIALAAIKELNKQNRELKNQNKRLNEELEDLKAKVERLLSKQ